MKKYKLIQTYPGSPDIGTEVKSDNLGQYISYKPFNIYSKYEIEDFPKNWEEVVGRSYEVLSLISVSTKCIYTHQKDTYKDNMYTDKCGHSVYYNVNNNTTGCNIHSIKRLSDGEVFTVGDNVRISKLQHDGSFLIREFYLDCNGVELLCNGAGGNGHVSINKIEKVKVPLFTTEDGVDIFKGDRCYGGRCKDGLHALNLSNWDGNGTGMQYFSTRKAAEEYILMSTPCLSINDVINSADNYNRLGGLVVTSIKNLTDKAEGFEK
tara:strand:+ start:17887 stop:18681 length:795 start_codon:yes stop_codon:yes gene_type:complete